MASQQRNAQTSFRAQKIQALQQAWVEVSARLAQRMDRSVPFSPSRKFIYADMIASRHPTLDQTEWHDGSIQDT